VSGRPFVVVSGAGQARFRGVEGSDRLAMADVEAGHLELSGLAQLDDVALFPTSTVWFGGVFSPAFSFPIRWGTIHGGRISALAKPPPGVIEKAPLEAKLGCDEVSPVAARFDAATAPSGAKQAYLRPDRLVPFAAEPGGPVVLEYRVPPEAKPSRGKAPAAPDARPGAGDAKPEASSSIDPDSSYLRRLTIEETRGKHTRVWWNFREGTVRAWVLTGDLRPLTAKELRTGVGYGWSGNDSVLGVRRARTVGERAPEALAVCDEELPLIVQTDDEQVLAGKVKPSTCVELLVRKGPHAHVRLRSEGASFGEHVTLMVRTADLRGCKIVEASGGDGAKELPAACLEPSKP
jgi:hypothetical protein